MLESVFSVLEACISCILEDVYLSQRETKITQMQYYICEEEEGEEKYINPSLDKQKIHMIIKHSSHALNSNYIELLC